MNSECFFNEPVKQIGCAFKLVERSKLKTSPYQRDKASGLVTKLVPSITEGFVIPVLVVEIDGIFEVIDGQHRLEGLDKLCSGNYLVPCIVVPIQFKDLFLMFNIEKSDNIRDKSTKVYNFYQFQVQNFPDQTEQDLAKMFAYQSYTISIAYALKELFLESPSMIESAIKKIDNKDFQRIPLSESVIVRRHRASRIKELENRVLEICIEYGIGDFNIKKSIITQTTGDLWGRKRNIGVAFDEGIDMILNRMSEKDWSWASGRVSSWTPEEDE